jgi:putative phosphoribosyl transferase
MAPERFSDRRDAGRHLAGRLEELAGRDDVVVLGLLRGGVPVAAAVAEELGAPLDVFAVRKLGVPWQPELAFGAVASGGVRVLNHDVLTTLPLPESVVEEISEREEHALHEYERRLRGERSPVDVEGRVAVLVDDGIATGSSMRAAIAALRRRGPRAVVVAVPVAPRQSCEALRKDVDAVVCARTPEPFRAVGVWYERFDQTTDDEVRALLTRSSGGPPPAADYDLR